MYVEKVGEEISSLWADPPRISPDKSIFRVAGPRDSYLGPVHRLSVMSGEASASSSPNYMNRDCLRPRPSLDRKVGLNLGCNICGTVSDAVSRANARRDIRSRKAIRSRAR